MHGPLRSRKIVGKSVPNPAGVPMVWQGLLLPTERSAEGMGPRNLISILEFELKTICLSSPASPA